jgi:hypothetical protein
MNSSHCSRLALIALVLVVVAAGPATAVSVSGDSPAEAQVGSSVDATYTLEDLYANYSTWTLTGETDLEAVTWTVTTYQVDGTQLDRQEYTGQSFDHGISTEDDVAEVTVRIQGTVPEWSNWSYDPAQSLDLVAFAETQQGGSETPLRTAELRPYSEDSQAARSAIEAASGAIDDASEAGVDVSEAQSLLENAISAYDAGNFGNAQDLAEDAQNEAEAARQSSQRTSTLLMIGGAVLVLAILAGLGYWYLQNRQTYDKLG